MERTAEGVMRPGTLLIARSPSSQIYFGWCDLIWIWAPGLEPGQIRRLLASLSDPRNP